MGRWYAHMPLQIHDWQYHIFELSKKVCIPKIHDATDISSDYRYQYQPQLYQRSNFELLQHDDEPKLH